MQKHGFICTSCLFQLRSLARRQPIRHESTLAQRVQVPKAALYLREPETAPWYLKRRIRRMIESELSAGLPKFHEVKRAPGRKGRSIRHTRWLKQDDPELKTEMKQNRSRQREAMEIRQFLKQCPTPAEIQEFCAWKNAFRTITKRRRNEGQAKPPSSPRPDKTEPEPPSTDEPKLSVPATERHSWSVRSLAEYHKAREDLEELLSPGDEESIRAKWMRQTPEYREAAWLQLALAVLALFPRSACLFIRATWDETVCPIYAVNDAVWFLVRRPAVEQSDAAATDLCDLLIFLLQHAGPHGFHLKQWDIWQAIQKVSSSELIYRLYQELVSSNHLLHHYTRLQFATRFGESATFKDVAFELLESLVREGELDVNSPHAGALCTTILSPPKKALEETWVARKFVEGTEMSESTTKYSERLLELGFNPNMITYSVLIKDLVARQEVKTALDVLKIMASQDLKPDALLYSFLLYGAKTSGSWLPMHMLVQQAFLDEIKDPVVWNELLHTVFMAYLGELRRQQGRRKGGMPAFPPMLKLYANIFKPGLLRKFIPADLDYLATADLHVSNIWQCEKQAFLLAYRTPSWKSRGLLDPGYDTLTIMILGYINSLSNPQSIAGFYVHFKGLVDRGDVDAVQLIKKGGTRIYDYILKAMLEYEELIGVSVGIVNDMLKMSGEAPLKERSIKATPSPRLRPTATSAAARASSRLPADDLQVGKLSLSPISSQTSSVEADSILKANTTLAHLRARNIFRHPAPSIHTWSILINGLMFHREADKAEKILDIMQEHGVEPSIVPYNTLIAGYANAQNVRKTIASLQRLEAAGFEGDDWTFKAWSYLIDKDAALDLMEGAEAARTKRLLLLRQQAEDQQRVASVDRKRIRTEMEAWESTKAEDPTDAEGSAESYEQALQALEGTKREASR